jgi:hypothetical protein
MNAFPSPRDPKTGSDDKGMGLRDYFAAHALQGMMASDKSIGYTEYADIVEAAYNIADVMLKARDL